MNFSATIDEQVQRRAASVVMHAFESLGRLSPDTFAVRYALGFGSEQDMREAAQWFEVPLVSMQARVDAAIAALPPELTVIRRSRR